MQPWKPIFKGRASLFETTLIGSTKKLYKFEEQTRKWSCTYWKKGSDQEPISAKLLESRNPYHSTSFSTLQKLKNNMYEESDDEIKESREKDH